MTTIYDGGPANPIGNVTGISIRDYFATAIMTGVYSSNMQATFTAEDAYRAADSMLAARSVNLYQAAVEEAPVEEAPVVDAPVTDAPVTDAPVEPTV